MARTGFEIRTKVEGADRLLRGFRNLPREAQKALRLGEKQVAETTARRVARAARAAPRQGPLLARTVKPVLGRGIPTVTAGGTQPVGRRRKPAYKVLFGSEFGGVRRRQFPAYRKRGYWFFSTLRADKARRDREWLKIVERVARYVGRPR